MRDTFEFTQKEMLSSYGEGQFPSDTEVTLSYTHEGKRYGTVEGFGKAIKKSLLKENSNPSEEEISKFVKDSIGIDTLEKGLDKNTEYYGLISGTIKLANIAHKKIVENWDKL